MDFMAVKVNFKLGFILLFDLFKASDAERRMRGWMNLVKSFKHNQVNPKETCLRSKLSVKNNPLNTASVL